MTANNGWINMYSNGIFNIPRKVTVCLKKLLFFPCFDTMGMFGSPGRGGGTLRQTLPRPPPNQVT